VNAAEALREFAADVEAAGGMLAPPRAPEACGTDPEVALALRDGASLATVRLVRETGRSVKANRSINAGVLSAIDAEAARQGLTRSALIEVMARRALSSKGLARDLPGGPGCAPIRCCVSIARRAGAPDGRDEAWARLKGAAGPPRRWGSMSRR
jgi:hypothetical protein